MDESAAFTEALRQRAYFPFRLFAIACAPDGGEWIVLNGKTKARMLNYARRGYTVKLLTSPVCRLADAHLDAADALRAYRTA